MSSLYSYLYPALWLAWLLYWWAAAAGGKRAVRSESPLSRLLHLGPLAVAAWLLWSPTLAVAGLDTRFVPRGAAIFWLGAVLTAGGLGFAVWARRHIGGNWSGTVTIKEGHRLVSSGPYAWVRHPIYTGLLFAFAGSALGRGEWRGILALVIVFLALWRKLKVEERWLAQEFGGAYDDYRRRVKALIPFLL